MSKNHDKKISHRRFYAVLILAVAFVCLLVMWLIDAASVLTSGFTKNMNTMYLREMTNLMQANFKSGLSMRYSGLKTVAESVNVNDLKNLENVERFISAMILSLWHLSTGKASITAEMGNVRQLLNSAFLLNYSMVKMKLFLITKHS